MNKLFYNDEYLNEEITSNNAIEVTLDDVLNRFYNLSEADGSFLGIKNEFNKIRQFAWINDNVWQLDIPEIAEMGSYQKECTYEECVTIIKSLFQNSSWQIPEGVFFQKW